MKITDMLKHILVTFMSSKSHFKKYSKALPGTKEWLIGTEIKYGGLHTGVPRSKISSKDPRNKEQLSKGGMTGGDRMLWHGYASKYSEYLLPYVRDKRTVTLIEVGILKGVGLAIWCDLFNSGRVLGLDIDLEHINNNMAKLRALGAFKNIQPELYEFDQLEDNIEHLGIILKGAKVDICIDDGGHSTKSILSTMNSVMPYLMDDAVYFIEDNKDVYKEIKAKYPDFLVDHKGELTIVTKLKNNNE